MNLGNFPLDLYSASHGQYFTSGLFSFNYQFSDTDLVKKKYVHQLEELSQGYSI